MVGAVGGAVGGGTTNLFFRNSKVSQNLFGFAELELAEVSISPHHRLIALAGRQPTPSVSLRRGVSDVCTIPF